MDLDSQLRQFKDFLSLYNTITEKCFNACVDGFFRRGVEDDENSCINHCVDKFANTNQLIMKTYVEVQGKINEKRMEDFNNQIKQQEEQNNQAQQVDTNTQAVIQQEEKPIT
ncbi:hypothetical protein PVAND_002140 [Polypedilum vanderplanki]|uniref:Mitochondrial import inner membrane translocase subunit n=1 Tax=Polypedilum vanderplanki TaxID=319348 RepID=A0A9J6BQI2_POLVA|nr:hypothetical protein PVAND_002140 [Polypedilum vanderplanki]